MSYQENRKYIISKFPFLRNLERYDKIIPKVLSTLVWPLYKPKKVNYNGKVFFYLNMNTLIHRETYLLIKIFIIIMKKKFLKLT